jgi:hypothetical protein
MQEIKHVKLAELKIMASKMYGSLVMGVVDIDKGTLVLDAELHADQEKYLLETGSEQSHLWGINLYPDDFGTEDFIEFDSMINIRPRQGNMSRDVEDESLRQQIRSIIMKKVSHD